MDEWIIVEEARVRTRRACAALAVSLGLNLYLFGYILGRVF
jgi:hypothetical protein